MVILFQTFVSVCKLNSFPPNWKNKMNQSQFNIKSTKPILALIASANIVQMRFGNGHYAAFHQTIFLGLLKVYMQLRASHTNPARNKSFSLLLMKECVLFCLFCSTLLFCSVHCALISSAQDPRPCFSQLFLCKLVEGASKAPSCEGNYSWAELANFCCCCQICDRSETC